MKKIAFVLPETSKFGSQFRNSVDTIAERNKRYADNQGFETTVIFPQKKYLTASSIGRNSSLAYQTFCIDQLIKFAPDIIEVHRDLQLALAISEQLKKRSIWYVHDFCDEQELRLQSPHIEKKIDIVCVSHCLAISVRQSLQLNATPQKVYNSIDFERFKPRRKRKIVSFAGRLAVEKSADLLLKAFSDLSHRFPDWNFVSLLDIRDSERSLVVKARQNEKESENFDIYFNASLDVVAKVFGESEIVIVPSRREPFGLVALEAHASGAAVISSMRDGLAEVSGDHGLMLESLSQTHIEAGITKLINHPETRNQLMASSVDVRSFFSSDEILSTLTDVWMR